MIRLNRRGFHMETGRISDKCKYHIATSQGRGGGAETAEERAQPHRPGVPAAVGCAAPAPRAERVVRV